MILREITISLSVFLSLSVSLSLVAAMIFPLYQPQQLLFEWKKKKNARKTSQIHEDECRRLILQGAKTGDGVALRAVCMFVYLHVQFRRSDTRNLSDSSRASAPPGGQYRLHSTALAVQQRQSSPAAANFSAGKLRPLLSHCHQPPPDPEGFLQKKKRRQNAFIPLAAGPTSLCVMNRTNFL